MKKLIGMLTMLFLCVVAVDVSRAAIITFQEGVGGWAGTVPDTVFTTGSYASGTNRGTVANALYAGYDAAMATYLKTRSIVGFTGITMPTLNPGETIQFNSAKIVMTVLDGSSEDYTTASGNYGFDIGVYEVLAANAAWTETKSTWLYRDRTLSGSAANWAGGANGCGTASDIVTTPMSTVTAPASANADLTKMEFAISTSLVQSWLAGSNYGVLFKSDFAEGQTANKYRRFYSSEESATARRPQLVVDYTVVVPEPATVAILGLGGLAAFARRKHNRS